MCELRTNKSAVVEALATQIVRRGDPIGKTMWGPPEIRKYVQYQLGLLREDKISRNMMGGYAFKLPLAPHDESGTPAPLPKDVVTFLDASKPVTTLQKISAKPGKFPGAQWLPHMCPSLSHHHPLEFPRSTPYVPCFPTNLPLVCHYVEQNRDNPGIGNPAFSCDSAQGLKWICPRMQARQRLVGRLRRWRRED